MKRRKKRAVAPAPAAVLRRIDLWPAAAVVALLAAALALYWDALRYPLVFDDFHLTQHALKTHYATAVSRHGLRWLSDASFWWVYSLAGDKLMWQRLANVLLHGATGALLFGFLARLFGALAAEAQPRRLAFFGALAFVLHPVAVYGVAYLIERSIVMATAFSLTALWFVLEGLLRRSTPWYAAAALAYLLAVSSKEHAVMVPAVAGALAVLVRGTTLDLTRRFVLAAVVLGAIAAAAIIRARHVIGAAYEPFVSEVFGQVRGLDVQLAYPLSIVNQGMLFFRYLATWLAPNPAWMSIDVRTPFPVDLFAWPHTAGFAAYVAYPACAALLLAKGGRPGLLGFALLYPWLLGVTELVTVRAQEPFVLYRSYLWMSGLPAALPAVLGRVAPRWRIAIVAAACLALVLPARDRLESFSSPLRLWDDAVRKIPPRDAPHGERAYLNRGMVHLDAGRLEHAGADFEQALRLNPRWADAYLGRGSQRLRSGRMAEALEDLDRALALDPRYASAYDKRCVVKAGLGRFADALPDCERAVELDPSNHEAWINAGVVYRSLRRPGDAEKSYQRALEIEPRNPSAHYNYGVLLLEAGRRDEAVRRHIARGCAGGIAMACDILKRSR